MPTKKTDVALPEPKKTEFVGFRLDRETQAALDTLARAAGGNRSEALRRLVQQKMNIQIPSQERESML